MAFATGRRHRPADHRAGWPSLGRIGRVVRFEASTLVWLYCALWLAALGYILAILP